jgi:hypothetical protein
MPSPLISSAGGHVELVWDNGLFVHYGFVFVSPADDEDPDLDEARGDQSNGLLRAAVSGALAVVTGTHTGRIHFRIEWHETEPPVGDDWQDVVEASLDIQSQVMRLATFDDAHPVELPWLGAHRVRLCASNMDAGREADPDGDEMGVDSYLLQLWPAVAAPDAIVRVGSRFAEHEHAEAETGETADHDGWVPWSIEEISALRDIPAHRQAEVPQRLARLACEYADIANLEPIHSALQALDRGRWPATEMSDSRAVTRAIIDQLPADRPAPLSPGMAPMQPVAAAVNAVFYLAPRTGYPAAHNPYEPDYGVSRDLLDLLTQVKIAADHPESGDTAVTRRLREEMGLPWPPAAAS